jgi:hypothetical protein
MTLREERRRLRNQDGAAGRKMEAQKARIASREERRRLRKPG